MEKLPADKEVPEENATEVTEEMDSDEMLSEPTEITDNTDSSNDASTPAEKKPEISQTQSDDTSGIEISSTSTTSASETPCEGAAASETAQPSAEQTEPAENETVSSASEIPCEGITDSDVEEKTEHSMQTETADELPQSITSSAEIQSEEVASSSARRDPIYVRHEPARVSQSITSAAEIQSEEVASSSAQNPIYVRHVPARVSQSIATGSEVLCEQNASDAVKEKDGTAASIEISPRAKKSGKIMEKVKKFLSPTKSKKSKEKSMSPTEKSKCNVPEDSNAAPEEARISSEGEEHVKNENEKTGMFTMKNIRKTFSKLSIKIKSSGTESTSLVTDEAIERAEEPVSKTETEVETKDNLEQSMLKKPQWTKNRTSLVEVQSLGGTTITDVPSTSSSSVFSEVSSRKPSAAGENTSEEAIAGSLVSSPEEKIPDNKEDEVTGNESVKEDVPSSEEVSQGTGAAENIDQELSSSEENPKGPEGNDERKPESGN